MKKEDFELAPPQSLRDVVLDELHASSYDDWQAGKSTRKLDQITDKEIEDILQRVYEHIEKQALEIYHSNEPWALKAWALNNILKDEAVTELNVAISTHLIEPILEWQEKQEFNPIGYYRERLETERKSYWTMKSYMQTTGRFVSFIGRKNVYSEEDILRYLSWANKKYKNGNTYYQEVQKLRRFLSVLPGGKNRDFPVGKLKQPTEFNQPIISPEDLEKLVWACAKKNIEPKYVVRILVASIYGARLRELANLCSKDIELNGADSKIHIKTEKAGQRRGQPIPQALIPLFAVPFEPMSASTLQKHLRGIYRKLDIMTEVIERKGLRRVVRVKRVKKGLGFHSIRRRVVTMLSDIETSEISIHDFLRWSVPRQFSMLARYRQTPSEVSDKKILSKHPLVRLWEKVLPYVFQLNEEYLCNCNINYKPPVKPSPKKDSLLSI